MDRLAVLVRILLLWRDAMAMATLIRKTFNWDGSLHFQRFSSSLSWWEAWPHASRCGACILQATVSGLIVTLSEAWKKRDLQGHPHSDALPPARPHFLTVPLPLGDIFFQTTTLALCLDVCNDWWESEWSFHCLKAIMVEGVNMSNINNTNWETVFCSVGNSLFASIF